MSNNKQNRGAVATKRARRPRNRTPLMRMGRIRTNFPPTMRVELPYVEAGSLVPGAPSGAMHWVTNGIDPTNGGTPSPIPANDALARLYSYYKVESYSGSLELSNTTAVALFAYFLHQVSDPGTTIATYQVRSGNRFCSSKTLNPVGSSGVSHVHKFSHTTYQIAKDVHTKTDRDYQGDFVHGSQTNPIDLNWFGFGIQSYNNSTNTGVSYILRLRLVLTLSDPQAVVI